MAVDFYPTYMLPYCYHIVFTMFLLCFYYVSITLSYASIYYSTANIYRSDTLSDRAVEDETSSTNSIIHQLSN